MAFIYVGLGDKDRAIAALEEASRGRHGMLGLMQSEVIFDSVASDPRFVELWSRLAEAKSN